MTLIEVYYNKCDNQLQSSAAFNILMGFYKEMHVDWEYSFLTKQLWMYSIKRFVNGK